MTLGKNDAIEMLEKAVAIKGADYIDPRSLRGSSSGGCAYADMDGNPLCIVGHVFALQGVKLEPGVLADPGEVGLWDEDDPDYDEKIKTVPFGAGHGVGLLYGNDDDVILPDFDEQAIEILMAAQGAQDAGRTWGEALAEAKSVARLQ